MDLDVGTLNGRAYTYVAAFGAFTEVSYATPQDAKKLLGENRALLDEISLYLLQKETITGDELMAYVNADSHRLPAPEGAASTEAEQ